MKRAVLVCIFAVMFSGCSTLNSYLKEKRPVEQPKEFIPVVANEVYSDAYVNEFLVKVCEFNPKKSDKKTKARISDKCSVKLVETFFARLAIEYPEANWTEIDRTCKAFPIECKEAATMEEWVFDSHNETRNNRIAEARAIAQAKSRAATAEAIGGVFKSMGTALQNSSQNRRVSCTSDRIGNSIYTDCQ
jgi:hypothetical protein